jgi:hypothetical protein
MGKEASNGGNLSDSEERKANRERADSNGGMKRILNFVNFLRRDLSDSVTTEV